ncbi:hypothetical protein TWF970_002723 [Orbilia oligospora]|uniref:Uncharacterized protein n=1 Tax=Orbilia oligospora TaxID=2813651 RepID=A0A7C8RBS9_ORBOL|nr:hypothetical protein TWF970_002723 [Orbilia oligospora]
MEENREALVRNDNPCLSDSSSDILYLDLSHNPYEINDKVQSKFPPSSYNSPSDTDAPWSPSGLFTDQSFSNFPPINSSEQATDQNIPAIDVPVNELESGLLSTTEQPLPSGSTSYTAVTENTYRQTPHNLEPPINSAQGFFLGGASAGDETTITSVNKPTIVTTDSIGTQQSTPGSLATDTPTQPLTLRSKASRTPKAPKAPRKIYKCTDHENAPTGPCVQTEFTNRKVFEGHLKEVHGIEKYLECPNFEKCQHKCSREDNLLSHIKRCDLKIKSRAAEKRTVDALTPHDMLDNPEQSASKRRRYAQNVEPLPATPTPVDLPLEPMAKPPILCTSSQGTINITESDIDSSPSLGIENPSLSEQSSVAKIARLEKELDDARLEISLLQKNLEDAEFDSDTWRDKARAQNRSFSFTKQLLTAPHTPDD